MQSRTDISQGGALRADQRGVAQNLAAHDVGALHALPGFGKTVIVAHLIAWLDDEAPASTTQRSTSGSSRCRSPGAGTPVQYVGRLSRPAPGKADARVVDVRDTGHPILASMARKRARGYRALGWRADDGPSLF